MHDSTQNLLQRALHTLCLAICLRVMARGKRTFGPQARHQSAPECRGEARVTVMYNIVRETVVTHNRIKK